MTDRADIRVSWGTVTDVVLDRPQRKNALTIAMQEVLLATLERAGSDEGVRVLLIRGEGDCFSSGHDLGELTGKDLDPSHYFETSRFYEALWDFPKPLIVAAQGTLGPGAAEIAMLADLAVAGESTVLDYEVYRSGGMTAAHMLPWVVGMREAKRILFTAPKLSATEALELGIFLRIVPDGELVARATALARLVAAMPALHLRLTKLAVNQCVEAMGRRAGTVFATASEALIRGNSSALEDIATVGLRQMLADQRTRFEPLVHDWIGE